MTTLMDEAEHDTQFNKARRRGDTRGQHRAELRAWKETTVALLTIVKNRRKRGRIKRALL